MTQDVKTGIKADTKFRKAEKKPERSAVTHAPPKMVVGHCRILIFLRHDGVEVTGGLGRRRIQWALSALTRLRGFACG